MRAPIEFFSFDFDAFGFVCLGRFRNWYAGELISESYSPKFGVAIPNTPQRVLHHKSLGDEQHRELQAAKLGHRSIVSISYARLQVSPPAKRVLLDHTPIRKVGSLVSWQHVAYGGDVSECKVFVCSLSIIPEWSSSHSRNRNKRSLPGSPFFLVLCTAQMLSSFCVFELLSLGPLKT